MTLGLNWEGIRQKYTYQKRVTNWSWKVGVDYSFNKFIYLNSPPVVVVNCDNRKAMGKEKWHKTKFEKSTKNDSIEFRKKNDKMEIKL